MDEAELWIRMLEAVARHAQACAAELRALRTQAGDAATTRDASAAQSDGTDDSGE